MKTQAIEVERVKPTELRELLEHGKRLQLIDVRSPREYDEGHVPGAVNVPLEQVEARLGDLHPHDPAVLICQSGKRADLGRELLERHRTDLIVLEGGTGAWVRAGLPVVKTAGSRLPLMRQVQIGAGGMAFVGAALGYFVNTAWNFLAMFVGAGLLVAGTTGFCGMANVLAVMPWNKAPKPGTSSVACGTPRGSCSN